MTDIHRPIGVDGATVQVWLTQQQLATRLNISQRSLERMRQDGTGPRFSKAGRKVLYATTDIEAWLIEQSFTSTAEARHAISRRSRELSTTPPK
jgi:predicted transcriptional regulator